MACVHRRDGIDAGCVGCEGVEGTDRAGGSNPAEVIMRIPTHTITSRVAHVGTYGCAHR